MQVDRALGHTGPRGDIIKARGGEALFGESIETGRQNLGPPARRRFIPRPRGRVCGSGRTCGRFA